MILSRDEFLKGRQLRTVDVDLPGMGTVRMREMSESVKVANYEMWLRPNGQLNVKRLADARFRLISLCLVDESGNLLVGDDDYDKLREFPSAIISRLADVAMSLCGLSDEDVESKVKKPSGDS